jgi:plasmid maintenance system antidote protein VapI
MSKSNHSMSARQFRRALEALKLGTASKSTMAALGVSISQIQRLANGRQKVSRQTQLLLAMYLKHPGSMPKAD